MNARFEEAVLNSQHDRRENTFREIRLAWTPPRRRNGRFVRDIGDQ